MSRLVSAVEELVELMYAKLQEKPNGELSSEELFNISCLKFEYGLRKVESAAIRSIRTKHDVEQLTDEKGAMYLKLIR